MTFRFSWKKQILLVLAVIALAPAAQARPVVYNLIVHEGEPVDQLVRERYSGKYEIVEIRRNAGYASARLTNARYPNPVFDKANVEVSGAVRVCFIITTAGRLADPFIVGSAHPLLEGAVLDVLKEFRATPARVKGVPVAAVEMLKFTFGPAPRRRLDTGGR